MVDACGTGSLAVTLLAVTGHRDDDRLPAQCLPSKPARDLIAIDRGQANIQQADFRPSVERCRDRRRGVRGDSHFVSK